MKNAIIIFGKPGSGKDTQSDFVAKTFNIPVINTGLIIRNNFNSLSDQDQAILNSGKLLGDESIEKIFSEQLHKIDNHSVLLDGFPRTLKQAEFLYTLKLNLIVLYLDISDEEAIERIAKRQQIESRQDDNSSSLMVRLNEYHQKTEPVLNYFMEKNLVIKIDGEQTIEEINNEIEPIIKNKI